MFVTALRLPLLVFAVTAAASEAHFAVEAEVPIRGGAGTSGFRTYRVPVAAGNPGRICFQPMKGPGEFAIRSARIELPGRTVPIPFEDFEHSFQIAELNLRRDASGHWLHVRTTPDATLPAVCIRESEKRLEPARGLGPAAIWGATIVLAAFVVFAALALAREVHARQAIRFSRRDLLCLAALFALIACAKLAIADRFASSIPDWDQWPLQWDLVYRPYSQGTLDLSALLAPHSEHRVPFVRLASIVLLDLNGIWDVRLEAALDVLLQAVTLTGLAAIAWKLGGPRLQWPAVILAACAGALPIGVENASGGFHTQNFYQIVALGVLSLGLLAIAKPLSPAWWLGFACSLCGGFVIASGALVPLAAACASIAQGRSGPRERIALACLAAAACVGFALIGAAPHHDQLKPRSAGAFALAVAKTLAWPMDHRPSAIAVLWLPLAALWFSIRWKESREWTPLERLLLSLGLWTALTVAALAYGRGGSIPSRYQDLLSPGFIANGLALVSLTARYRPALAFALVWTAVLAVGLERASSQGLQMEMRDKLLRSRTKEENVARFVRTGDRSALYDKPLGAIPFPSAPMLDGYLRSPVLRTMLPPVIREPDAPLPFPGAGALSRVSEPVLRHAWIGVFASIAALFVLAGLRLREGFFLFAAVALRALSSTQFPSKHLPL